MHSTASTEGVIEIVLNGRPHRVAKGASILDLVAGLGLKSDRVAVEVDRRIAPRGEWPALKVTAGSRVEVVQFVGGG